MRRKSLLERLQRTSFLTVEQLAADLHVSTRTIRDDIKLLNEASPSFDILRSKHRGYYLVVRDEVAFQDYCVQLSESHFVEKEERIRSLVVYLLLHETFTTNQVLADDFEVSIGQIKKDSALVSHQLASEGLYLERKAHYGLRVIGNLYQKLQLLDCYAAKQQPYLRSLFRQYLSDDDNNVIAVAAGDICQAYHLRSEGESAAVIQRWLALLRLYHDMNDGDSLEVDIPEMRPLKEILNRQAVTAACVGHAHLLYQLLLESQTHQLTSQTNLRAFLESLFIDVDERFKTQFMSDVDFLRMVHVHIAVMLESRQLGESRDSFLIESMEREFPAIMNAAIYVVKRIEEQYQLTVSQEEIGYLTSHMAVSYVRQHEVKNRQYYRIALVCSSGGGLAQLMSLRFAKIFPQSLIREFALHQEQSLLDYRPDLVFTIKPLDFAVPCPVVQIKEVLGELDYFSIQNNLDVLTASGSIYKSHESLIGMIKPGLFVRGMYQSYQELLKEVGHLVEEQLGCAHFEASILERESYVSTVYDNGVAIPHPMEMTGTENAISVTVLPRGIPYEGKTIRVVFMLSLKPGQVELHQYISQKLYTLMQHRTLVKELSQCHHYQEFIQLIRLYL